MSYEKAWRRPFFWAGDTGRHTFLSDAKITFKIFTVIAFTVALILLFVGWPGTLAAAGVFFLSWILWMIALVGERMARRGLPMPVTSDQARRLEEAGQPAASLEEARVERIVMESAWKLALEIFAGIVLVSIALAVFLARETLTLGILLFVAYLSLFGAPYWVAAVAEKISDERTRLTGHE